MKPSQIAEHFVGVIGCEAAGKLFAEFGGKIVRIPDGTGRASHFTARLTEIIGEDGVTKLRQVFGGESLTIPTGKAKALIARNRQIIADCDAGMRMIDLIHKYNLTERRLRSIINSPLGD